MGRAVKRSRETKVHLSIILHPFTLNIQRGWIRFSGLGVKEENFASAIFNRQNSSFKSPTRTHLLSHCSMRREEWWTKHNKVPPSRTHKRINQNCFWQQTDKISFFPKKMTQNLKLDPSILSGKGTCHTRRLAGGTVTDVIALSVQAS